MPFHKTFGIDLGTSTVKIYSYQKDTILTEKNMIAIRNDKDILAVGNEAYEMYEKNPSNIVVESPMAFGKIANIYYTETVLQTLLHRAERSSPFGNTLYLAVPTDMSEIEKRAYFTIANKTKKSKVRVVEKPISDAIALGIPLTRTKGSMIVNFGAQSTEISVIAEGKVIVSKVVQIGGKQLNEAICSGVRRRYNLHIGTRTARRLKISLAYLRTDKKEACKIWGIDSLTGLPREGVVSSSGIYESIKETVDIICEEIKFFLERTPPQIYHSIKKEGIYLTGGSARLPDIEWYMGELTGYRVNLSSFYELCTVYGLKEIINNKALQKWAK